MGSCDRAVRPGTLTFATGETRKTISVSVTGDTVASVTCGGGTTVGGALTFREGESRKIVNLTGLADSVSEGVENVTVELANPVGATVAAGRASAAATISDGALPGFIGISSPAVTEGDSGRRRRGAVAPAIDDDLMIALKAHTRDG